MCLKWRAYCPSPKFISWDVTCTRTQWWLVQEEANKEVFEYKKVKRVPHHGQFCAKERKKKRKRERRKRNLSKAIPKLAEGEYGKGKENV